MEGYQEIKVREDGRLMGRMISQKFDCEFLMMWAKVIGQVSVCIGLMQVVVGSILINERQYDRS
jgi:hypothetical protein